jgi:hypothetical protein
MRECTVCHRILEINHQNFYKSKRSVNGFREQCRSCVSEYNRTRGWANHIRRKYGMVPEDYHRMFDEQDGRCLICEIETKEKLHIDHDHATGVIRGLLCTNCNRALGHGQDDPEILRKLADYVENRRSGTESVI